MTDKQHPRTERPLLPCPSCGAEAFHGEKTTVEAQLDFEFGGQIATYEAPAQVCPECDEVFAL